MGLLTGVKSILIKKDKSPAPKKGVDQSISKEQATITQPSSVPTEATSKGATMDISESLKYTSSAKAGTPATWTLGKVVIKAPVLKGVCESVMDLGESTDDFKSNMFHKWLGKADKKNADLFFEALDLLKIPYLDVVKFVAAHSPQKGKASGSGSGKSEKVMKAFAKALATKYPAATSQASMFDTLAIFLASADTQGKIFKAFTNLAQDVKDKKTGEMMKGISEDGMITLRKMTKASKEKAVAHGQKLGAEKAGTTKKK